jgi:hypothetical protein
MNFPTPRDVRPLDHAHRNELRPGPGDSPLSGHVRLENGRSRVASTPPRARRRKTPATLAEAFAWSARRTRTPKTGKTCVVVLIAQRQQAHNRDMTRERRHVNGHSLATALHWVRSHLPRWRRRPPLVGVREPRRPKPTLPAAAVALKEPRAMRWIKLGNRHTGGDT